MTRCDAASLTLSPAAPDGKEAREGVQPRRGGVCTYTPLLSSHSAARFTHETLAHAVDPPPRPPHTAAARPPGTPRTQETLARAVAQALTPPPRPQARPTPTRRTRTATSTSSSRWSPSRTPRPRRARPTSFMPRPTTVPFPSVLNSVAQWIAYQTSNLGVAGSSPVGVG